MQKIIKDGVIVESDLVWISNSETLADTSADTLKKAIVPLSAWLEMEDKGQVAGIWLESDENTDQLAGKNISALSVIGVHFPAFADGRGFTHARLLRERFGYKGEIRALGNFIPDQLGYLLRVGFSAFQFADEVNLEKALQLHKPFSVAYQSDVADPRPLFLRR
ncbi:DUF934 domain-containing protein [Marinomonas agarivorans]|nr:DUF934 domain-containing protein [Marinomonas agarivorans]